MRKPLLYTLSIISILLLIILIHSIYSLKEVSIFLVVFWIFLASTSESLPVVVTKDKSVTVTFAIILAAQLSHGVYFATLVGSICHIFIFYHDSDGTHKHIFSLPFHKTIMNIFVYTIAIFISGILFEMLLIRFPFSQGMPYLLCFIFLYVVISFLVNSLVMTFFISLLYNAPFILTWLQFIWAFPNFLAIAPIGFFIHKFYELPSGYVYVILLLGPLLLARYSFKLYLDSKSQYYKTVKTLTVAIEAKDKYTEGHSKRVEIYAEKIAQKMKLPQSKIDSIKVAALLHDIGKIGIEDSILRKEGNLTPEEWIRIQQHPSIGAKILEDVPFPDKIKDFIEHHHEKYNGTGYPGHLKGSEVSIEAYILSAADAYDAMTSNRPYRKAMTRETAMGNILKDRGTHFHPDIADIFLKILKEEVLEEQKAALEAQQEAAMQEAAPTLE